MGIDLVLPDFTYLRERVDDIEAIVITHGHEDHLGALPWVLRELGQENVPVVYGGQLTVAMARSKLDEHKLRDVNLEVLPIGDVADAGPFEIERVHLTHSIPDAARRRARPPSSARCSSPATTSSTRRRSAARRPTWRGWPSWAARACCCCAATPRTPTARASRPASRSSARTSSGVFAALPGPDRRHLLRVEHPPRPAGRRRGGGARPQGRAGRALDAQERQHRPLARATSTSPRACSSRRARSSSGPTTEIVIISTGLPGRAAVARCAGWPTATTRRSSCKRGDTVVFSATPIPGNERAVNETIDRLYHVGCDVMTARDAPIHASGHGYAEELKMMLNLTRPRYVMPVHGDYKRMLLHGAARRGGRRAAGEHLPDRERHRRWRSTRAARGSGDKETAGHGLRRRRRHRRRGRRGAARPPHAVGRRHLHHRRDGLRAGRLVGRPARGARPRRAVPGRRERSSSTSCARRSRTRWTARPSSRSPRSTCSRPSCTTTSRRSSTSGCKRRPMVLPVVVEV